jgi:putative Mg2+ transporter-C (MgtC) family protein
MEPFIEYLMRLVLAAVLASFIGIEREHYHKPAGLRTHVLVCLGAALLSIMAITQFAGDSARIVQGIVTGIGFLGAGSIIAGGRNVQGLTTAATLWVSAILGVAVGLGFYMLSVALTSLIVIVLVMKPIEKKL